MIDVNWRPYQVACFKAIHTAFKEKGLKRQLVIQATGTGKRIAAVNVSTKFKNSLFLAHSEELIEQAVKDMEKFHGFMNVGVIKGSRFEIDKKVVVASPQTLINRLDRISPNHFALVQIDECFPAGTLVDKQPIEIIEIGDYVHSFNHQENRIELKKVINVIVKEKPKYLYDFGVFSCTKNHPIYINKIGYCLAKEIYLSYTCHTSMCYLYDSITFRYMQKLWNKVSFSDTQRNLFFYLRKSKKNKIKIKSNFGLQQLWKNIWLGVLGQRRKKTENIHGFSYKRFWLLFYQMQKGVLQGNCKKINDTSKQKGLFGKNEEKQSDVQSGSQDKDDSKYARKNIPFSRRKWSTNEATINDSQPDRTSNGICDPNEKSNVFRNLFAISLQSRSSRSSLETCDRNRWKNSQVKTLEVLRQTENERFEFVGLDCSKIYKRRSRSKSKLSGSDNFVYNLEVEDNNNYFVENILVHNCHRYLARTWVKAVQHFKPQLTVGWTATPYRLDGLSLADLFDDITFEYNIAKAIEDGFLCELDGIRIKTETDLSKVHRQAGDFKINELSNLVDTKERNKLIVESYQKYCSDRQAIGFCVDVLHAIHLREAFIQSGISCEILVADENVCPDRKGVNSRFRGKETKVLLNVQILIEGWDYADVGAVLMARPTQSLTFYMQSIGRGCRLKSPEFRTKYGLNDCKILDFVDNSGKHNLINTWTLDKGKTAKEKTFVTKENKEKLLFAEKQRREAKIDTKVKQDGRINLLKLPELKIYGGEWTQDLATPAQLDYLKKLGLWEPDVEYTKGMCNELISNEPAQYWQLKKLSEWGYDVSGTVLNGQYSKIKQKMISDHKYDPNFKI
jgi:superfamily II DNA or RNA helicase